MKKSYLTSALSVVALVVCMGSAQADFVPPGTPMMPIAPAELALTIGGPGLPATLLASTGPTTVSTTISGTTLTVTYVERVYSDPLGLCAGCLDFVIQAINDSVPTGGFAGSNTTINHVTTGNYSPLQGPLDLEMGSNTGAAGLFTSDGLGLLPPGAIAPTEVERTADGSTPEFDFGVGGVPPGPPPGTQTTYLILKTTALSFIPGTVSFQDGVTAAGAAFAPAPEPRMVGFVLLGMLAIVAVYRRKRVA